MSLFNKSIQVVRAEEEEEKVRIEIDVFIESNNRSLQSSSSFSNIYVILFRIQNLAQESNANTFVERAARVSQERAG